MRTRIYIALLVGTVIAAMLYGRFSPQDPWKVVGSTSPSPRVSRAGTVIPPEFDPKLVEDLQVVRDFGMPWNDVYDYHVVIATFRYENEDRIAFFNSGLAAQGTAGGRRGFANCPELARQVPVEAQLRIAIINARYHYFIIGWVNGPGVRNFVLKLGDGHEVTLDAEEHEFFILHRDSDRLLSPPPSIDDIVIVD